MADGLFLYDVTSSYLEGEENALATFGYNRDGKKGKQQIVVGLLCNSQGVPLSIEVFEGNTQDPGTVLSQVRKVADRFGGGEVTFVGDRGMIKGPQIEALGEAGFHYITAITKPTIERLLAEGRFQMNLFDNVLAEVEAEGVRYVLRRNPVRQAEMAASRQEREGRLRQALQERNAYLVAHPRARVEVALAALKALTGRLKLSGWMAVTANERVLVLTEDATVRAEDARLDGCYTLKTDLPRSCVTKEVIHERYKDLAKVEQAFRTSKTAHLELRPVYVRRESRTRGHALVVMLAYRLVQELRQRWSSLDCTVEEGIAQLSTLTLITITVQGVEPVVQIPKPTADVQALLDLAHIRLPAKIPSATGKVSTKNRLPNDRKLH